MKWYEVKCKGCKEPYEEESLHYGYCEDCYSDLEDMPLEERLDKLDHEGD